LRPAVGGTGVAWQARVARRARDGGARLARREETGGSGRVGRRLPRSRRRVARGRMFDVYRDERRPTRARPVRRQHQQPQLRGPAGQGRPHVPGQPAYGRGDGADGEDYGCENVALDEAQELMRDPSVCSSRITDYASRVDWLTI